MNPTYVFDINMSYQLTERYIYVTAVLAINYWQTKQQNRTNLSTIYLQWNYIEMYQDFSDKESKPVWI